MTTLGLGLTGDPRGSRFKNLNLVISAKSIASPKVPCTGSGNMCFGDTVRPSMWYCHHALLCNGPILQVNTQNHQQCPGSPGAPGLGRVCMAIGWLWSAFLVNFARPPQGAEEAACDRLVAFHLLPHPTAAHSGQASLPAEHRRLAESRAGKNVPTSAESVHLSSILNKRYQPQNTPTLREHAKYQRVPTRLLTSATPPDARLGQRRQAEA